MAPFACTQLLVDAPIWACMLLREMGFRCFVKRHAQQRSSVAMKVPTRNAAMPDMLDAVRSPPCHMLRACRASQALHQTSSRLCITPGAAPGQSCRSRTKQKLTCQPFVCDLDGAQAAPHQPPSHLPSSISSSSHPHRQLPDDHRRQPSPTAHSLCCRRRAPCAPHRQCLLRAAHGAASPPLTSPYALPSCFAIRSCGGPSMMGRSIREEKESRQGTKGNLRQCQQLTTDRRHRQANHTNTIRQTLQRPCLSTTPAFTTPHPINTLALRRRPAPPSCRPSARPSIRATRPDTTTRLQTMETAA